jgi:two-component system, NarL family, nitrate/nitrite response regulator NarL
MSNLDPRESSSTAIPYVFASFPGPIRVAIADNNQMDGELLTAALKRNRRLDVVASLIDSSSVRTLARERAVDVLVISRNLDDLAGGGFKMVRQLRAERPEIKTIVLLDSSQHDLVVEAFWCGALGVFLRSGSIKNLSKCISCVYSGQVWASSQELRLVLQALTHAMPPRLVNSVGAELLTHREQDVVRCLGEGLSNREVARRLGISEHTVKNYLFHIFDKLGVSSRVEVALYASGQCLDLA